MEKKVILAVLIVSTLVVMASFYVPVKTSLDQQYLPWHIALTDSGDSQVFGLILGQSTLADADSIFQGTAEVSLFASPDENYKVEAYYDKVILGGFNARLVLEIELSTAQLKTLYHNGSRISNLGGGRRKVTLSPSDLPIVRAAPIGSIAYLTRARLDEQLIRKRFGEPVSRLAEPDTGSVHWLYPGLGLDIVLDAQGNSVLQYVSPRQFSRLQAPLQALQAVSP